MPLSNTQRASELLKYSVKNSKNEDLGKIEDLVIHPETGRCEYAVLSFGGFLGMGEKLFAIPLNALKIEHSNKNVILDLDKEKLKKAPGFEKNHWPDMADTQWGTSIHQFYGLKQQNYDASQRPL